MKSFSLSILLVFIAGTTLQRNALGQSEPVTIRASSAWILVGSGIRGESGLGVSAGLPPVDDSPTLVGFGGGVFLGRWYLGGSGTLAVGAPHHTTGIQTRVVSASGGVDAGYALLAGRRAILYPTIGLEGGGATYRVSGPSGTSGNPPLPPGTRFQSGFGSMHAAINLDIYPAPNLRRGSFLVGLTVKYNRPFARSDWSVSNGSDSQETQDVASALERLDPGGIRLGVRVGWGVNGFRSWQAP